MNEEFILRDATRQGLCPIICFFSESGCGKTYSGLLLARGMAGPTGKIMMGDSESGRGAYYSDVLPGGYKHFLIDEPFSPDRYVRAVKFMEDNGAAVGLIDSASHEWEGPGGVCDMAAQNEERSGKSLNVWNKPKQAHKLFMISLLRTKIPLIICLRAKFKTRQTKDEKGKTVIAKDDYTSPLQADDFLFEMTCHAEIMQDHKCRLTKCSHPDLRKCFPADGMIEIKHGELLARWCQGTGEPVIQPTTRIAEGLSKETAALSALKKELWKLLENVLMGCSGKEGLQIVNQYLYDEIGMDPDKRVEMLTVEELGKIVEKVKTKKL